MQIGLKGDGKGGVKICSADVYKAIKDVRDRTSNPKVARVMQKALEAYSQQPRTMQEYHPGADSSIEIPVEQVRVGDIDPVTGKKILKILHRFDVIARHPYVRYFPEGCDFKEVYYGERVQVIRKEA